MIDVEFFTPRTRIENTNAYEMQVGVGNTPRKVSGYTLLVQIWISSFLSNAGSDISNLDAGGGVLGIMDEGLSEETAGGFKNKLVMSANKTNQEVMNEQISFGVRDTDELLKDGGVSRVTLLSLDSSEIEVFITNQSNVTSSLVIPVITV